MVARIIGLLLLFPFPLVSSAASTVAPPAPEDTFTSAPFAQRHASTVVELRNGGWLAAWFGGSEPT